MTEASPRSARPRPLRPARLALALWLAGLTPAAAQPQEAAVLIGSSGRVVAAPREGVLREQRVGLELSALDARQPGAGAAPAAIELVRLDLFGEELVILELTERRPLARGGYSWVGRAVGDGTGAGETGQAVLVVRNGKLYGSFRRPGLNLQIRPDRAGAHRLEERDEAWWPEGPGPVSFGPRGGYLRTVIFRDIRSAPAWRTAKYTPLGTSSVNHGVVRMIPSPRSKSSRSLTSRPLTS